jgi:ABC-type multidrug transport system ATPase subunit
MDAIFDDMIQVDENKKVIDVIRDIAEFIPLEKGKQLSAAQFLERFLFSRDMHYNYVYKLSGGEKRRLKLMTVLMANPNFLILDEPTSGLDPNQLLEIRDLIKRIGQTKTVMLSTHIMQEVEAICDRVIIINNGVLVADDTSKELQKSGKKEVVIVEFDDDNNVQIKQLQSIKGVKSVKKLEGLSTWLLESEDGSHLRKSISQQALKNSWLVLSMRTEEKSLEQVFKELTRG